MTTPCAGTISVSDIDLELNQDAGTAFSLGGSAGRALAAVASGEISLSDYYCKTNFFGDLSAISVAPFVNKPASAKIHLDWKRDGTFYIYVTGLWSPTSTGPLGTFNWYTPTTTIVGDSYQVQFIVSSYALTGNGTITTTTSTSPVTINTTREFYIDSFADEMGAAVDYSESSCNLNVKITRLIDSTLFRSYNFTLYTESDGT